MGNRTFQVFFFIIIAFKATYAAKHPICLDQEHIMRAKSVIELEKLVHPLCLKEKIGLITNQEFQSLRDWKKAYRFMEMAERTPLNWVVFNRVLPFLEADSSIIKNYDRAWALLENAKYREIVSQFLDEQVLIKNELKKISRSQAASAFIKRKIPFL